MHCYVCYACVQEGSEEGRKTVPFFTRFDKLVMDQWLGKEGVGVEKIFWRFERNVSKEVTKEFRAT